MKKLLLTTLIGGLLFLVPLVFVFIVLREAMGIMTLVATPLGKLLPLDSVAGVGLVNILAVLLLLALCLLAGVLARSAPAQTFYRRLDGLLLELIPGYAWTKTVLKSVGGEADTEHFKPVLVSLDDQQQLAFEMERCATGQVVVFFPGAPDVRSGTVAYVSPERVQPLAINLLTVNRVMKHMGKGAAELLPRPAG